MKPRNNVQEFSVSHHLSQYLSSLLVSQIAGYGKCKYVVPLASMDSLSSGVEWRGAAPQGRKHSGSTSQPHDSQPPKRAKCKISDFSVSHLTCFVPSSCHPSDQLGEENRICKTTNESVIRAIVPSHFLILFVVLQRMIASATSDKHGTASNTVNSQRKGSGISFHVDNLC
jgi:hypothetical protein